MGNVSRLVGVIISALLRRTLSRSEPRLSMNTPMLFLVPNSWNEYQQTFGALPRASQDIDEFCEMNFAACNEQTYL